jgi:dUTP pyrophosphatase
MDICAAENVNLISGSTMMVSTGLACAVPEGYELQCRPRSGLASKGITIVNSPGTIDSDYRGEIKVLMLNTNPREQLFGVPQASVFRIERGDRIAQLVLSPVTQAVVEEVDELDETERGAGGFGSTGRN